MASHLHDMVALGAVWVHPRYTKHSPEVGAFDEEVVVALAKVVDDSSLDGWDALDDDTGEGGAEGVEGEEEPRAVGLGGVHQELLVADDAQVWELQLHAQARGAQDGMRHAVRAHVQLQGLNAWHVQLDAQKGVARGENRLDTAHHLPGIKTR